MKYFTNILEKIGDTPLIKLNRINAGLKPLILVKVEYFNPGGSVKDRIAFKMLEAAEKEGKIKKGSTIVEPTSGNTGLGLAMAAAIKGYKAIFVIPDKTSKEKESLLRAFGAEVIRTPSDVPPEDPRSHYKVAERLAEEIPGAFSPNQYFNMNNPAAHYETTGPEIWRDTGGKVTHFVAGIGTGGTISGVGKYLKEKNPKIKIIGVDPEGSIYNQIFKGETPQPEFYYTEGIGGSLLPGTLNFEVVDEIIVVKDKDAFLTARRMAKEEGLLVGISSGAAVYAALKIAEKLEENHVIVVLLPDSGRSYLSTLFNDEWMKEKGLL